VPFEYDPLLAKLIAWGKTREEAVQRMRRALSEYRIYGIKTTVPFFQRILSHPQFLAGLYTTHFIGNLEKEPVKDNNEERLAAVLAAGLKSYFAIHKTGSPPTAAKAGGWKLQGRLQNLADRL